MSFKQLIRRQTILKNNEGLPFVIPGDPMLYSLKYELGSRIRGLRFFRNLQWKSFLKCHFESFPTKPQACVLLVTFYTTPPVYVKFDKGELESESVPAMESFELSEYSLSLLEMLHGVLIKSYKHVVKIDMEKFYSDNPRTIMRFMRWSDYVFLCRNHSVLPEAQS